MPDWVNVKDKLPAKYAVVLVSDGKCVATALSIPPAFLVDSDELRSDDVTHWMPLPKLPEVSK